MKRHFENVLEIQNEQDGCWVLAFRYDMMMRQTYMVFKVGPEGTEMADIGVRNPRIYRLAERDTIRYNDDMYLDNPYAITGAKSFIDPFDGSNWAEIVLKDMFSRGLRNDLREHALHLPDWKKCTTLEARQELASLASEQLHDIGIHRATYGSSQPLQKVVSSPVVVNIPRDPNAMDIDVFEAL
ncbi:uncharacterized protein MELLADRAFT_110340 [Melampsora larici-populina 98AG31]|uniref:Uncharacterized protein n=1 Tax=Melampsora larici-populina (strain 98AG31 / pathotype 3-4-7) TaxID=747676 RepID=F4RZF9_MELLP|nr:uncharacterized protein MELLADRAFT_110340 [Melampsora larici-populina 98AG31]EGG02262.1 hypothetical protein MELLADRAFT_110340 [Melampsora larici-populina 98AG31]